MAHAAKRNPTHGRSSVKTQITSGSFRVGCVVSWIPQNTSRFFSCWFVWFRGSSFPLARIRSTKPHELTRTKMEHDLGF
jgi:hypothetical protein